MKKCVDCGKPTDGVSRCEHCRKKLKEWRLKRKTQGICYDCGWPAITDHNYCQDCLEKIRQRRADVVQQMNIEGVCQACSSEPVHIKQDGKLARFCLQCLAKRRLRAAEQRQKGCCINCGKPAYIKPNGTQGRYCEEHNRYYREWHRQKYNERKEKGLCTKCGQVAASDGIKILTMCDECLNKKADRRYRKRKGL